MRVSKTTYSIQDFVRLSKDLLELKCLDKKSALLSVVRLKSGELKQLINSHSSTDIKPLTPKDKRALVSLLGILKIEHYLKDTLKFKMKKQLIIDKKNCAPRGKIREGTHKLYVISRFIEDKYFQNKTKPGNKAQNLSLALFTESVFKQVDHQLLW